MKQAKAWAVVLRESDKLSRLTGPAVPANLGIPALFKTRNWARAYIKAICEWMPDFNKLVKVERVTIK